jgi:hypothetical protein
LKIELEDLKLKSILIESREKEIELENEILKKEIE